MHSPTTGVTAWSSDSLDYDLSKEKIRLSKKPICRGEEEEEKKNDMLYLEAIKHNNNE